MKKDDKYWEEEYRRRVIIECHKKDFYEFSWDNGRFTCGIDNKPLLASISKKVVGEINKEKDEKGS